MRFSDALSEILRRADIVQTAERLGLKIGKREAQYTTALCPFHADRTPSLALYREVGNPHYYCFACGARGGLLDLVEAQTRGSRAESLRWLAEEVGVDLPEVARRGQVGVADFGAATFLDWLKRHNDSKLLRSFAKRRGLDLATFVSANAFAVDMNRLSVSDLPPGEREALDRAGVLSLRRGKLTPVAAGKQIVFPVDGMRGFIFRAAEPVPGEKSGRYRFSKGLRKSDLLFGLAAAQEFVLRDTYESGVFVVEGLMDVLRLRSLGLAAVAVLGTSVSRRQAELLGNLCVSAGRSVVPAHLFLDADDAGRRAAPAAIRALLSLDEPMPLDVIRPSHEGDPDELLLGLEPDAAIQKLSEWARSVLAVLAHHYSRLPLESVLEALPNARPLLRVETLRYIVSQVEGRWFRVRDLADPGAVYLGAEPRAEAIWLRDALDRAQGRHPVPEVAADQPVYRPIAAGSIEPDVHLRRALRIAQSSNFRREYPFDWGGMTRLALAANATTVVARALLAESERRPLPYPARFVPKDDGRVRLKAGPWPEDALAQQYVMSELLRARPEAPGWYLEFPAVRLIRSSGASPITTGPDWLRPVGKRGESAPVVSFAYQIDQEIVEGDAPPRREGMFVPYRECWQQFIDHLDGFVARQPLSTDTFYAVRLDISGFFDNLPRYAVDQVLQPAIATAVRRHFSGRDFGAEVAPLLLPPEPANSDADNVQRAGVVAQWLADQSFGYRFFDPGDGTVRHAPNRTVGLPQGPDLSAFLANLALYPVDRAVTEVIEAERRGREAAELVVPEAAAVYGRYVDDMVIVSTSQALLGRIEATIARELSDRHLSMNAKHERTKALDRRKIRDWLLGERGAAVLVSAGGEETPTTRRATVEELLDVGPDTARSQVLQLLHHDDLYSPRWSRDGASPARVEAALRRLRGLPSVSLRYYDWVSAARWALHSLAVREPHAPAAAFADRLLEIWWSIYPAERAKDVFGEPPREREARQQVLDLTPALMLFDALERSIDSRHDRRGEVDAETRHLLRLSRERLTRLVHENDLLGELQRRLRENPSLAQVLPRVAGMLRIQELGIRGLAATALGGAVGGAGVDVAPDDAYPVRRFALNALSTSIRRHASALLRTVDLVGREDAEAEPLLAFHEALARLLADGRTDGADPLSLMRARVEGWVESLSLAADARRVQGLQSASVVTGLVDQFLLEPTGAGGPVPPSVALPAFVEVVAGVRDGPALMAARKHLVAELGEERLEALAVPPGIDALAFFARAQADLRAFAFARDGERPELEDVLFGVSGTVRESVRGLAAFDCQLPASHQIAQPQTQKVAPGDVRPEDLRLFARAYRDLAEAQSQLAAEEGGEEPSGRALTPLHLLRPRAEGARWSSYGTRSRLPVGPQAFVRLGEDRLHSIAVHANGAPFWQVGFALADNLGYRGFARSSELDRLTVATLEPNDTVESVPFYIMQAMVPRLCGALAGRTRFPLATNGPLPGVIARQLDRLETIRDGEEHALSNLTQLLDVSVEAKALELIRDAPAPLQVAGALSAVFRNLARGSARSERIFAQNLPPPGETPVTHRRNVDVWLAAASRLEMLEPPQQTLGLRCAAAAFKVLAISKLAQTLSLEIWSLLSDEDWQRLGSFIPELSDFDLPDEALLVAGGRTQRAAPLGDQSVKLISLLRTHAAPGATARAALDQITPLGWVVTLATLSGLVGLETLAGDAEDVPLRPELLRARREPQRAEPELSRQERLLWDALRSLARYLACSVAADAIEDIHTESWPWSPFAQLLQGAEAAVAQAIQAARLVEALYGFSASTKVSRFFQVSEADDRGYCLVHREGGRQNIAGWQIDRDSLTNSRPGDLETRTDAQGGVHFVWSETTHKGRLVSLSVAYRSLADFGAAEARLDGGGALDGETRVKSAAVAELPDPRAGQAPDRPHPETGASTSVVAEPPSDGARQTEDLGGPTEDVAAETPTGAEAGTEPAAVVPEAIAELTRRWHESRGGEDAAHGREDLLPAAIRIAILQMDINVVGHSFYHPACEVSGERYGKWEDHLKGLRPGPLRAGNEHSPFEAWRRAILREALLRCRTLKVELLVLPEYATRPETVAWLAENLEQLAPETSVLAGTFRHAARAKHLNYATGTNRPLALGAVVPLVVPAAAFPPDGSPRREPVIYSRLKKYPSTGLSELMRPEDQELRAVYEIWPGARAAPESLRYVRDLICSEVFVATAPANIYSCVPALMDLRQRFAMPISRKVLLEQTLRDVAGLGYDTSPAMRRELARPRKTIIAVPAATTRPSDHHIFGEAGAKAAGLSTVFANMAGKRYGQSCFIGHYKSECVEGSHVWALQSPYHGRAPGLWTYHFVGGQPLGPEETALVVADVNPIDTNVSKPARQLESLPITLVAHVPFFLEAGPDAAALKTRAAAVAEKILQRLDAARMQQAPKSSCELDVSGVNQVAALADELAKVDTRCKLSLEFRAEGAGALSMQPHAEPALPLLIDWAFVPKPTETCLIEVPPLDALDLVLAPRQ